MGMNGVRGTHHGIAKVAAAGGLIFIGYCGNGLMTSPADHQAKIEAAVRKDPAAYTLLMERSLDFSYNGWVEGQKQKGVDVGQMSGVVPTLNVGQDNSSYLSISDLAGGSTVQPGQQYRVRRLGGELSDKLGTRLACGTDEQIIDQFAATVSSGQSVWDKYPAKKKDIIKDYVAIQVGNVATNTYNWVIGGINSVVDGVKSWFK